MSMDKRSGGQTPKWANRESTPGVKVDSGPFIGIIKNNADPARQGRLQVYVPDLGGDEQEASNWFTVRYASPFLGTTIGLPGSPDENQFGIESQTYGFWAVPPDINNLVLVTFIMGDPGRGYYFACIPNTPSLSMIPGISRMLSEVNPLVNDEFKGRVDNPSLLPVTEKNTATVANDTDPNFINAPRLIHSYQANIIIEQGLDRDISRGTITSSAQRDTPSQVFGISTPGRYTIDTADFPNLQQLLASGDLKISTVQSFPSRKGGHTFVMDDGNAYGKDNLVRLRSAGGHTVLLNDTDDIIYIINKTGNAWVELTKDGSINVFSQNSVNIRAEKELNFHADANVNIHSGDSINFYAEKNIRTETKVQRHIATQNYHLNAGKIGITSGSSLLIKASTAGIKTSGTLDLKGNKIYLNTNTPADPETNPKFEFYKQENVEYNKSIQRWFVMDNKKFDSIAPFTPTHEPWTRQTGVLKKLNGTIQPAKPQTPKEQK